MHTDLVPSFHSQPEVFVPVAGDSLTTDSTQGNYQRYALRLLSDGSASLPRISCGKTNQPTIDDPQRQLDLRL